MRNILPEDAKTIGREKLHLAIENLKQAELEGAEQLAPSTYKWAKEKIYNDKKLILKYPNHRKIIERASEDAASASAQLLSIVREHQKSEERTDLHTPENSELDDEQEAIKEFVNEGGPVI